jgi:hypothetical protein
MTATKSNIKRQENAGMSKIETIEARLGSARLSLNQALLSGTGDTAKLRQAVRELEGESQAEANAQASAEAAKRAATASAEAQREASIRAASQTLQEARNARLNAVRSHLSVRAIPEFNSFAG